MKLIKLGAASLNQTPLDWSQNKANIEQAISKARSDGVNVLCLPELCISGYGCEDAFLSSGVQRTALEILVELVPLTSNMIVAFGLPLACGSSLFDAACLVADGKIIGFVAKRYLAGDGVHYEPRWFKPWPTGHRAHVEVSGVEVPCGDIFFDCSGVRIGFEICEDAWSSSRPGSFLAENDVDLILNPSASHFAFGKQEIRKRFVLEGSRAFGVGYVYANLLGNEAGRVVYDGGALIASKGELIAASTRFSFSDFVLTSAVIDLEDERLQRRKQVRFSPKVENNNSLCVNCEFSWSSQKKDLPTKPIANLASGWEKGNYIKEEEFARAVSLALFDYCRKSRSNGFVVSLSGGADSSCVASLIYIMVELGAKELGLSKFIEKLRLKNSRPQNNRELIRELLCCVYQATKNSSTTTKDAARVVAETIGAQFFDVGIEQIVGNYTVLVQSIVGRDLDWSTDDVSLQNIQARVRGPLVWFVANLKGALLLATSNRSEAAVGYTTMDGDTCGGLSPIAGIDKAFLLTWLSWLETSGPDGIGSIPELKIVTNLSPTAELRPLEFHQTDESDLMPYRVLDAIERLAIRDKKTPLEVFILLTPQFVEFSKEQFLVWIERFFRLWSRNQWKRERYAPSIHLDDENLDPKTWCRFPILSGGFERELIELKNYAAQLGQNS